MPISRLRFLALGAAIVATHTAPASAQAACTTNSLAAYVSLGALGCTNGGLTFSDFQTSTFRFGGSAPVPQAILTPDSWDIDGIAFLGFTVTFASPFTASSADAGDLSNAVLFRGDYPYRSITSSVSGAGLMRVSAELNGTATSTDGGTWTGDAVAINTTYDESFTDMLGYVRDEQWAPGMSAVQILTSMDEGSVYGSSYYGTFANARSSVASVWDLTPRVYEQTDPGTEVGDATGSIESVRFGYSTTAVVATPEPATVTLLAAGLIMIGAAVRHRAQAAADVDEMTRAQG